MIADDPARKDGADIIHLSATDDLACARQVLELGSAGLDALALSLDDTFIKVIDLLQAMSRARCRLHWHLRAYHLFSSTLGKLVTAIWA